MNVRETVSSAIDAGKRMFRLRAQFAHDYVDTFERNDAGKRVLKDVLDKCGLLHDVEDPCDPDTRSYHAGRRAVGIFILQRLRWSEAELVELARQQTAERLALGASAEAEF